MVRKFVLQFGLATVFFALLLANTSFAFQEGDSPAAVTSEAPALGVEYAFDNFVLFMCAVLVFLMQAGFAMVEAGFNSRKNAVNILFKNAMDISLGVLLFYLVGFGLMYPANYAAPLIADNDIYGFGGLGLNGYEAAAGRTLSPNVDFLFQAMFAATAATIVSGAVAGRMKVVGYLIYSVVLTAFVYPVSGYWKWGYGWADDWGFKDFAGSAVVHGVGGFAALAGAIILGARKGRFVNGKSVPMPGHNIPLAALGVFILWFGWYGFNPGSQLGFSSEANIDAMMHIAVTTTLAAAAGGIVATLISWVLFKKPDLSMSLNGILGGLVGITACCDCMTHEYSILVGAVAGVLVFAGVIALDRLRIDDPVGAFPVHGLCGVWGCMAIGILPNGYTSAPIAEKLFGTPAADFEAATGFVVQLGSTAAICGWAFVTMAILFTLMRVVGVLRVSAEDEQAGLDVSEHGMHAYAGEV